MIHELIELFKADKLGAALLLILFALFGLIPIQVLRTWKSKKEDEPLPRDSGKRLAFLEAERERRTQEHFRKLHDISGFVTELGFKVGEMQKDVLDLTRRVDEGEAATVEFRDRLLRMELSATAFARHAKAARESLERPVLTPGGGIDADR